MLAGFEDKTASAVCTLALCEGPGSDVVLLQGRCEGKIVEPRGDGKFGWDPVFQPADDQRGRTFAEMTTAEKNKISHRSKAVDKLVAYLNGD